MQTHSPFPPTQTMSRRKLVTQAQLNLQNVAKYGKGASPKVARSDAAHSRNKSQQSQGHSTREYGSASTSAEEQKPQRERLNVVVPCEAEDEGGKGSIQYEGHEIESQVLGPCDGRKKLQGRKAEVATQTPEVDKLDEEP